MLVWCLLLVFVACYLVCCCGLFVYVGCYTWFVYFVVGYDYLAFEIAWCFGLKRIFTVGLQFAWCCDLLCYWIWLVFGLLFVFVFGFGVLGLVCCLGVFGGWFSFLDGLCVLLYWLCWWFVISWRMLCVGLVFICLHCWFGLCLDSLIWFFVLSLVYLADLLCLGDWFWFWIVVARVAFRFVWLDWLLCYCRDNSDDLYLFDFLFLYITISLSLWSLCWFVCLLYRWWFLVLADVGFLFGWLCVVWC